MFSGSWRNLKNPEETQTDTEREHVKLHTDDNSSSGANLELRRCQAAKLQEIFLGNRHVYQGDELPVRMNEPQCAEGQEEEKPGE